MKRWILAILAMVLMLSSLNAAALTTDAGFALGYEDEVAVYIGAGNQLYFAGDEQPILDEAVRVIVYVNQSEIYFTTADETAADHDGMSLLMLMDTDGKGDPVGIAQILGNALWNPEDDKVYFVRAENPSRLCAYNAQEGAVEEILDTQEPIVSLRLCAAGLLVATEAQEKLFSPALQALIDAPYETAGLDFYLFGRNEAILDSEGNLSLRLYGLTQTLPVDTAVHSLDVQDGVIYYFRAEDGRSTLKSYDIARSEGRTLYEFSEFMIGDLTCDAQAAYFVGETTAVMRYLFAEGKPQMLTALDRETVKSPHLQAFYGLLLIYDLTADSDQTFEQVVDIEAEAATLVSSTAASDAEPAPLGDGEAEAALHEDEAVPYEEIDVTEETPVAPAPEKKEVPVQSKEETTDDFQTLSRGARGDDVARLQKTLIRHGYLSGSADGVYGGSTETAVLLLQEDMGYQQTGSAGPKFQYALYHGKVPDYEKYIGLQKGDEGPRVTALQERLRALYYMKTNAGGHYKTETAAAVKRFQKQHGYKETGKISASQIKKLFSSGAKQYTGYLDLQKGDRAPAVKRLCTRLKKLGYYTGKVTSTYNSKVKDAVYSFQAYNGLLADGVAYADLQSNMIFDSNASPYEPAEPEPKPEPEPSPKSLASKKQLKTMTNWLNKHFKKNYSQKQAVTKLQKTLAEMGLYTDSVTKVYDENTFNAVSLFQSEVGLPVSGIADKATLKAMYA